MEEVGEKPFRLAEGGFAVFGFYGIAEGRVIPVADWEEVHRDGWDGCARRVLHGGIFPSDAQNEEGCHD